SVQITTPTFTGYAISPMNGFQLINIASTSFTIPLGTSGGIALPSSLFANTQSADLVNFLFALNGWNGGLTPFFNFGMSSTNPMFSSASDFLPPFRAAGTLNSRSYYLPYLNAGQSLPGR